MRVLTLGLATAACGARSGGTSGAAPASSGWPPDKVASAIEACIQGYGGTDKASAERACGCVMREAQKRWKTPAEYGGDSDRHNRELVDDGVVDRCREEARVRSGG
jgi:hypothetical protein